MSAGRKKKRIRTVAFTLAGLIVAGGALGVFLATRKSKPVEVVPVSQWELGWQPDRMSLYGGIESSDAQSIFADKDVTVTEMLVAQGDAVRIGDPLLRYDATLDAINLELKQMEMQQLEYELVDYYKEYKRYARKDYVSTLPSPTPDAGTATGTAAMGTRLGERVFAALWRGVRRYAAGVREYGSASSPDITLSNKQSFSANELIGYLGTASRNGETYYVCVVGSDYRIDMEFPAVGGTFAANGALKLDGSAAAVSGSGSSSSDPLRYSIQSPTGIISIDNSFAQARIAEASSGTVYTEWEGMNVEGSGFTIKAAFSQIHTPGPTDTPDPTDTPEPGTTPLPTPEPVDPGEIEIPSGGGGGGGLSKEDKEALARAAAQKIRDAELEYKQLRLDLQNLALRGTDGVIRATIDGVVSVCNDPADTPAGSLLVQVKGSEGYFVRCTVGEMDLPKVPVGTELSGYSYENGSSYTGIVVEVGTVPLSGGYYYGGRDVSQYEVRIYIEDGTSLMPGYYIEFSLESREEQMQSNTLYLYQAYVREEDGRKYVCVARDGILRFLNVETGRVMYGYVEIVGDALTRDDYIAFPYSKDAKEGAPVQMPEDDAAIGY